MYSDLPVWKVAPFFRILLFLITGLLIQWSLAPSIIFTIILSGIILFFLLLIYFLKPGKKFKIRTVQGCLISLLIVLMGTSLGWLKMPLHDSKWYGNIQNNYLLVTICSVPVQSNKIWKAEGIVNAFINSNVQQSNGRLLLSGQIPDCANLAYGKMLLIKSSLNEFPVQGNPGTFDYRAYMADQGIFHRLLVKNNSFVIAGNDSSFFQSRFFECRQIALGILRKYISGSQNIAMAEALLLGYKNELTKDVIQAYSNAGVVHIIAISGLHLGLIYLVLQKILLLIPFLKRNKKIQFILIISGLWFFTFITGSAPSAIRSAVMFSFIVAGQTFGRQHSIYNAIFSSAFFMLCYDPMFLKDIGFQLSYLAVISIVWLQQPVNKLFYISNPILKKLWSLLAVSLVAQLLTTPLCIYYFHQFPNLFLLSNLIAVPVSSIILFECIFIVCIGWWPSIAAITGKLISFSISLLNGFIIYLDKIPYSTTKQIALSFPEMWLIYFEIITLVLWILHKYRSMFYLFLISYLTLLIFRLNVSISNQNQYKLIVYKVARHSATGYFNKGNILYCGDSIVLQNKLINQSPEIAGLEDYSSDNNNILNPGFVAGIFNNNLIVQVSTAVRFNRIKDLPVDVLILSHNGVFSIYDLVPSIIPRLVIFDSSNSLWKIDKWINECEQLHLPFYSVAQNGAFVFNVK